MIIKLTGAGTKNKGAYLLATAVADRFRRDHSNVRISVESSFGSWGQRCDLDLVTSICHRKRLRWRLIRKMLTQSIRRELGICDLSDVSAIIDVAGFRLGDQFGPRAAEQFATELEVYKKAGSVSGSGYETRSTPGAFLRGSNLR
jgi:hypothetical protein